MATPAQRAAEFKTALAMLARLPGANDGMINDALRQHVVELTWADDLRQHELGSVLLAEAACVRTCSWSVRRSPARAAGLVVRGAIASGCSAVGRSPCATSHRRP